MRTAPGEKPLALDWSKGQPKELWRKKVGWGYSAAVVQGNHVYTMGYGFATGGHEDTIFCFDAETGKTVWSQRIGMRASGVLIDPKRNQMPVFIGPRSAPVLDGDFLYAFCQDGKVVCFKATTGEQVWLKELDRDPATAKATSRPRWCYAGTPLVLNDMLVLSAGAAGLALNKKTGALVWTSGPETAGQASPLLFHRDGKPRLAVFSAEQFCTLDPADGKILWKSVWPATTFPIAPDPVVIDDKIMLCGADRPGTVLVAPGTDKPLWENKDLAPRAGTPIFHEGYLYGPNQSAHALVSIDAKDGSTKWTQKLDASSLVLVGERLIVQSVTGELTIVEASPARYRSLGSFRALDSDECWTKPTVAGNRLFVRSWEGELAALDLSTLVPAPAAAKAPAPMVPPFRPAAATDWYQWRGPNHNGISPETGLNLDWDKTPPKILFRRHIGYGYPSAAVAGDCLYTAGWSWRTGKDTFYCLNANTGDVVWTHTYDVDAACWLDVGRGNIPQFMGPRATVALDGDRLYWLAADGQTFCFDAANGKILWYRNLKQDKEAEYNPEWFISGSPLVLGDRLLLNTKTSGVALDKMTGRTLWASKGKAGLASPVPFTQEGKSRVFFRSSSAVFSVDPSDGKVVWSCGGWHGYDSTDPLLIGDNVLICGCYGKHSRLFPMTPTVGGEPPKPIWSSSKLLPHVATPVLYKGYLYSPAGYLGDSTLACADPKDGNIKWKEDVRVEGLLIVDGKIIAQGPSGTVYVADATPEGYKPHGSYKALTSEECWTSPSLSGGRLYVRSWEGELVGLDLRCAGKAQSATPAAATAAGGADSSVTTPSQLPSAAEDHRKPSTVTTNPTVPSSPAHGPSESKTVLTAEDWPCWRGPQGDNNSAWVPETLPTQAKPRWKAAMAGAAHSGVVVSGGRVVVMDHEKDAQDIIRCLNAETGEEVWKHAYDNRGKPINWGSCPRATPAISGGIVCALGARGRLHALDLQTGHVLWQKDLAKDFRAEVPSWGYCSSPLVAGDRLIVNPGSPRDSLVALDLKTGKTVWSSPGAEANYGSLLLANVPGAPSGAPFGSRQIIGYDQEDVFGRSAADGRVIWSKPLGKTPGYLVPSPIVLGDQLLLCGGNGAQLQKLGAQGKLSGVWDGRNKHYKVGDATPTLADGMALAVVADKGLTALELGKGLKILWETGDDGMESQFASVIAGNGRALVLDFAGTLLLFNAKPGGAKLLGKLKMCDETYAAPALARGRLYVRDEKAVYCYDLPNSSH
ncbi:MAG: PQQ-binding-like beta-propeller repeat protein [Thermoguttaceae bacterium]